jgi:tetratricopeptide (TPR) repeat protein
VRYIKLSLLVVALATVAAVAQSPQTPQTPLSDNRISVNTLLREDLFAGFLTDDAERFARGEKNLETLLEQRPAVKSTLLAWKAGVVYYRAVRAYENNRRDEFEQTYRQALDLLAQARQANPQDGGVYAIMGGVHVLFADRLPKEKQAAAWAQAYDAYQVLWKGQGEMVDKLPVHLRGELLGGLAVSAQRTGHTQELDQYLDRIIAVLGGTPYEPVARQWKKDPASATKTSITCLTCHEQGRLAARITALDSRK